MPHAIVASRQFTFDAAHRVTGHESKCRHLHGHTYRVELEVISRDAEQQTDAVGRVLDFSVLKEVAAWCDEHLDHGFVCHPDDPYRWLVEGGAALLGSAHAREHRPPSPAMLEKALPATPKVYAMPAHLGEPTAENLAALIAREGQRVLDAACAARGLAEVNVTRVRVWETPNCYAEWLR